MEIAIYLVAIWILAWLWYQSYNTFLACWIPSRAKPYWLDRVNALGGRFFPVFRWTSPMLFAFFTVSALINLVLFLLMVWRKISG